MQQGPVASHNEYLVASPMPPTPFCHRGRLENLIFLEFREQIRDFCSSGEVLARFGSKKGIPVRSDPTQGAHLGVFFGIFCAPDCIYVDDFCQRGIKKRTRGDEIETKTEQIWKV